jgi:hypothetical protein
LRSPVGTVPRLVIPAKAGIHPFSMIRTVEDEYRRGTWIPACAGMTRDVAAVSAL